VVTVGSLAVCLTLALNCSAASSSCAAVPTAMCRARAHSATFVSRVILNRSARDSSSMARSIAHSSGVRAEPGVE